MADLFTVTAPLAIRYANGEKNIMIERIPYQDGLAYLAPFWTEAPLHQAIRIVAGPLKGDGPWKVGDHVVTVLGCHGTDAELANEFAAWQMHREQMGDAYPAAERIKTLMTTALADTSS